MIPGKNAEAAFNRSSAEYIGKKVFKSKLPPEQLALIGEPIMDSIAVDGACNSSTGIAEYRVVDVRSGELIHQSKEYADGTNNIVEFIAIVHALGYCKQKEKNLPIYSDSMTAITWVRNKAAKTKLIRSEKNQDLYDVLSRAVKWLHEHTYENPVLKWQTKAWGENPADFGRK
mgnify:CR=1 FL=1